MSSSEVLSSGRLPHLGILRFTGADAASFLQGQLSNDTSRLAEQSALFAAYSSPQGRVLTLIYLLPHSTGIVAILPRELLAPTMERLRKFIMRAKVKIDDPGDSLIVVGVHGEQALSALGAPFPAAPGRYIEQHGMGVAAVGLEQRFWVIASADTFSAAPTLDTPGERVAHDWRLADIRAGRPQIYSPTSETFVAQMLNLDLLDGISFTKGCYTGQEIIARTQHLGRIKRRMFHVQLPAGDWQIGQALQLNDGRQGRVVEVSRVEDGHEALAVLSLEAGAETDSMMAASAMTATLLPLPYSIAAG
jgi:folate-binding protein YgfZ